MNNVRTGLRALLRWLYLEGNTPLSLAAAVPTAPSWWDSGLPRAVGSDKIQRLLATCDRRTNVGRRDWAILTVLARLGLRAGEVAALQLDDVDCCAGEIEVLGKGNRRERLPLPVDVGQAIADYCGLGRRRGECRRLLLHVHAPHAGLSHTGINQVFARACERAGLPRIGAHQLRHSAACTMRAAGGPLLEIGQVSTAPGRVGHSALRPRRQRGAGRGRPALARGCGMSSLHERVEQYLAIRRSLGFKLEDHGRLLPQFIDYLDQHGATTLTVEAAFVPHQPDLPSAAGQIPGSGGHALLW